MSKISSIFKGLPLIAALFCAGISANETEIKLGWQVPWAIQGHLVQVFKHTDILKKNNIKATFIGKNFGPELNELALADQVDVILTADQPAAVLFSKDKGWVAVSRLMYNRTSTYVPPSSPIKTIADLKGKTLGVPFGAAAERVVSEAIIKAGLKPKEDVKFVNLAMTEHTPLAKKIAKDAVTFDQFDAMSGFDPIPASLESQGLVRSIDDGKVVAMVLMKKEFATKNAGLVKNLKNAIKDAYEYYMKNESLTNAWFNEEAKIFATPKEQMDLVKKYEPIFKTKTKKSMKIDFSNEDFEIAQRGADFVEKSIGKKLNMKDYMINGL